MKIYHYHPITKEFLCEGVADKDPMVLDGWLIPAHATSIKPIATTKGKSVTFQGDSWVLVDNYRGYEYWDEEGNRFVIQSLGQTPPENHLKEKPLPAPIPEEVLRKERELKRVLAYTDPTTGSDKLFLEAIRKRAEGLEEDALVCEAKALQRVMEIKEAYPLN